MSSTLSKSQMTCDVSSPFPAPNKAEIFDEPETLKKNANALPILSNGVYVLTAASPFVPIAFDTQMESTKPKRALDTCDNIGPKDRTTIVHNGGLPPSL
ncbi:hypothetical protein TVAG_000130 [Trichomonas vaginalis G3]|uniref:Uncharacterized protein n=1 Tax=Trichomonas vaginalis (strain ATCC PRA-98 / G3) TaxID=412133 RepID=A2FFX4_TRIV3|nr:hypothetical protein TVAGG3_0658010 [Trichomonas vaginalis G3]EAX96184.1 hypothetical protein TVAG_000130 [Trichomonas vaginalis G3]KAI5506306.1 hypothetical protein TVAGG3_0658010 [Trichomonas vaginalis G3]|eukprot:XP_001309114.1 hypothetical protein [Trichomonas vaginalis G3]